MWRCPLYDRLLRCCEMTPLATKVHRSKNGVPFDHFCQRCCTGAPNVFLCSFSQVAKALNAHSPLGETIVKLANCFFTNLQAIADHLAPEGRKGGHKRERANDV
jgi:hypothetical protein